MGAEEAPRLAPPEVLGPRPFLRYERPSYRNFAFDLYTNYADHTWGQRQPGRATRLDMSEISRPQALWGPLGDYLATGYDLFTWIERRQPEQRWGSELFKDWPSWSDEFNNVVVASDGYRGWGYSAIVGDGLIARLTPLTLSKTDLNGLRMDVSLPHVKFTGVGSRIARPNRESSFSSENAAEVEVDHSTLLAGGRAQAELGALHLGLNGVNLHSYNSTEPNNSMKGQLRRDQPLYEWLIVRISDDAPTDGRGGAVVQEVQLILNGEVRPDLQAQVIRQRAGVLSQVGRTLSTGAFVRTTYTGFQDPSSYYRGREIPTFADYLYRLAYEAGEDYIREVKDEVMFQCCFGLDFR